MGKLIVISGPSGSGKTYLARFFSDNLNIPYFCKDDIKEILFDTIGWSDKEWSRQLGAAAIKTLFFILEKELVYEIPLIAEANFKPELDVRRFRELAVKHSVEILEFHCFASKEKLSERFKKRVLAGERHPGHLDHKYLGGHFEVSVFGPLKIGRVVEVDTNDFTKIDYNSLLQEVADFIKTDHK